MLAVALPPAPPGHSPCSRSPWSSSPAWAAASPWAATSRAGSSHSAWTSSPTRSPATPPHATSVPRPPARRAPDPEGRPDRGAGGPREPGGDVVRTRAKPGSLAYHGQAVGPAGQPAAGLYIYVGVPDVDGFRPNGWSVGRTDKKGQFTISCPHAPVLLAPWPLLGDCQVQGPQRELGRDVRRWRHRRVAEAVPCTRSKTVDVTRWAAARRSRATSPCPTPAATTRSACGCG